MKNIIYIFFILTLGCSDLSDIVSDIWAEPEEPQFDLNLHLDYDIDDNGFYHTQYPSHLSNSYGSVKYEISPPSIQRTFWFSPDSFNVVHQGQVITSSIICCSTYSNGTTGKGQQMFYLNPTLVGDTLDLIGCLSAENCKSVSLILH